MHRTNELTLLPKLPLLITESADEFDALRDAFEQEIKPRGIIEQMHVHDISSIVWEILRLRRCKAVIINAAFRGALQNLLEQVLRQPGQYNCELEDEAQALAQAWFTDQEAKKQVSELLSQFELDESAIEAEAIRRSSSDLELLDRMLTSLESRHGLTLGITSTAALAKLLDKLARKIAGDTKDPILLERARAVAQAQLDLARVRQAKVASSAPLRSERSTRRGFLAL